MPPSTPTSYKTCSLQDVLARLDKTYQAFFRRVQRGEKAGFPRFKGHYCFHSFTFKEYGNGARLENGYLVLSKIGRIALRWSRPIQGTPKTVTVSRGGGRLVRLLLVCARSRRSRSLSPDARPAWMWA